MTRARPGHAWKVHPRVRETWRVRPRVLRRPALLALAAGLPVVETIALIAAGQRAALGLAPQATAIPPFGVLHDLRWLFVYTWSAWSVALALVALVVVRAALHTALVVCAWPDDRPRPGLGEVARRSLVATIVGVVLVWPIVTLEFAAAATALATVLYAGLLLMLLVAPTLTYGVAAGAWWRRWPPLRSVVWVYASFVVLSLAAGAIELAPLWLAPVVAAVAGVFDAWAWTSIVSADLSARAPCRRFPAGVFSAFVAYAVVVGSMAFAFGGGQPTSGARHAPAATPGAARGRLPVLLVAGFGSRYDGTIDVDLGPDTFVWRYSYAGFGRDGRPRPYDESSTYQSLDLSVDRMAAQVARLHTLTGRPVLVVATSEGSVVARSYVGLVRDAPVNHLLMLSPLIWPDQVYWPAADGAGRGDGARWAIARVGDLASSITKFHFSVDMPFLRSLLAHADALRAGMSCPAHGVDVDAVVPAAGTAAVPSRRRVRIPVDVVSGFHGSAVDAAAIPGVVRTFLRDGRLPANGFWNIADDAVRAAASAWRVPEMPLDLNAAWDVPGGSPSEPTCATAARGFARWRAQRAARPGGRAAGP
ncbi:MAG TPA: hypothetical protein VFW74_00445 [Acidimicrobiia bacterium]|nr:hypothetical protein [Acidimicrobiia bacterium]